MLTLEVYDRNLFDADVGFELDEASPVAISSEDDYSAEQFEDAHYRCFSDMHYLGIFQTVAGICS
jgi:hypothetical protein